MKSRAILTIGALGFAMALHAVTARQQISAQQVAGVLIGKAAGPATPVTESPEPRWGRATVTWNPERWPSNRSDWNDWPAYWELRRVADVQEIPAGVREELERLGCSIPRYRPATVETSVIWGELERSGQRDLAVLCARADQTSATYIFYAADPARRQVMPQSGSSITLETRAAVQRRLDPNKPLEPDMPATVDHDALEIGCCECCSTIFYLHRGRWFTLPGAD
jgi:hypothetical protein